MYKTPNFLNFNSKFEIFFEIFQIPGTFSLKRQIPDFSIAGFFGYPVFSKSFQKILRKKLHTIYLQLKCPVLKMLILGLTKQFKMFFNAIYFLSKFKGIIFETNTFVKIYKLNQKQLNT